jgi:hypothetical protein
MSGMYVRKGEVLLFFNLGLHMRPTLINIFINKESIPTKWFDGPEVSALSMRLRKLSKGRKGQSSEV